MKDICQALFEYLSSREEIVSQVGTRIYPILLPQDAPLASIVYAPVLCNYDSALQGDTGYVRQTIRQFCLASSRAICPPFFAPSISTAAAASSIALRSFTIASAPSMLTLTFRCFAL